MPAFLGMMRRFEDRWYCDTSTECDSSPYAAVMSASPWYTGLAKTDLPMYGDGSVSHVANEEDFFGAGASPCPPLLPSRGALPSFTFPWCPPLLPSRGALPSFTFPFSHRPLLAPLRQNADRSEVFQTDTAAKDADRYRVADTALSDTHRKYHFVLLHFTDADSQVRAIALTLEPSP